MAEAPLRVLIVEDLEEDCLLVLHAIKQAGLPISWRRVTTRDEYMRALGDDTWDVILSDHSLPSFNSVEAQRILAEHQLDVPFIVVSGTIGDEQAVESMRAGARDYVLKDNLGRLVPAIRREVGDAENRRRRRLAEEALKRSEEQLRHAQKMEAVGRLAGGVAHDFNNLLTAILGFSHLALERVDDPSLRLDLEQVIVTADRAARLTSQLLAFSRQQAQAARLIDLGDVLRGLEPMLRCLVGEEVKLVGDYPEDIGHVFMDSSQVEQIVMNLAVNARDAMPSGGQLTLRTRRRPSRSDEDSRLGYLVLEVGDTGTGMDSETLARAFEPFFTTKEQGRGTGLGLSTIYGIVQQNAGAIEVRSQPGAGTTFLVHLPIAAPATAEVSDVRRPSVDAGSETILVVEDEPSVRSVLVAVLTSAGYHVIDAEDPEDAMAYGLDPRNPLDLLVTDMAMPKISGRELARQIRGARPKLRLLFLSGYGKIGGPAGLILPEPSAFLQKPFGPTQLLAKVRERLDAPVGDFA